MPYKDKEKNRIWHREYMRKWRKNNPKKSREIDIKGIKRKKESRRRKKQKLIKELGGGCTKCGYDKNYAAIDFHHKDPSKKETAHEWLRKDFDTEDVILVCSNCHREIHYPECQIQ